MSVLTRQASLVATLVLVTLPAGAHHSSAQYDDSLHVTVAGVVTSLAWSNPHSHLYVEARDGHGTAWQFDLPSVNRLVRLGWTRHALNRGDRVTVTAARHRTLANIAWAVAVVDSNGKKLFVDSGGDPK